MYVSPVSHVYSEVDFDMEQFVGDNIPVLVVGTKQVHNTELCDSKCIF